MPASAQQACYGSNWYDSQRAPPPQIRPADISSATAKAVLTLQTSASYQPLSTGSDTLGLSAPSLLRKLNTLPQLASYQMREPLSQEAQGKHSDSQPRAIRSRACSQYTRARLGRLPHLRYLGNPETGLIEKISLRPSNATPQQLSETNSQLPINDQMQSNFL